MEKKERADMSFQNTRYQIPDTRYNPHKPVLLNEVITYLNPKSGGVFIDATINGGGHALVIAERIGTEGRLLGMDRDGEIIKQIQSESFKFHVLSFRAVSETFANIRSVAEEYGFTSVDGILFDLGFSSFHIEQSGRGFSFLRSEQLDMRYNPLEGISAREIINNWSEDKITSVLYTLGEERYARRIARRVAEERERAPLETTDQLVDVIKRAVPASYRHGRIHFATRTFQALRMCVNDELEHVAKGIAEAISLLATGGRIAVISFHSGEDRVVKELFRKGERALTLRRITKKPVRPDRAECQSNPRSRSAKLRVAECIGSHRE